MYEIEGHYIYKDGVDNKLMTLLKKFISLQISKYCGGKGGWQKRLFFLFF